MTDIESITDDHIWIVFYNLLNNNAGYCVNILDKEGKGNCLRTTGSKGRDVGQFERPCGITYLNKRLQVAHTHAQKVTSCIK